MKNYKTLGLCLGLLVWALPSFAEREIHAVGVYEGLERTNGEIHGPRAYVLVDRPDHDVTLLLTSYERVTWVVVTTEGTRIEDILLGGYQPEESAIDLNGAPYLPRILSDLPSTYRQEGEDFRALVSFAAALDGFAGLSSFHGAYRANDIPFDINSDNAAANHLRPDYLAPELAPETTVPLVLRHLLENRRASKQTRLTDDGFFQIGEDGEEIFHPITLDVPVVSWASGAVYVPEKNALFGVSLGGEGFLYQLDLTTQTWSVLASMQGKDGHGMIYDPKRDALVMAGGMRAVEAIYLYRFEEEKMFEIKLDTALLKGVKDLYDPGNGPGPSMQPLGIEGDTLLLQATSDRFRNNSAAPPQQSRIWSLDLETGDINLMYYFDPPAE